MPKNNGTNADAYEYDQLIDEILNEVNQADNDVVNKEHKEEPKEEINGDDKIIDDVLNELEQTDNDIVNEVPPKEEVKEEKPAVEDNHNAEKAPEVKEVPKAEEAPNVKEEPKAEDTLKKINNEARATMFINKLNAFNSMFKTNIEPEIFISAVTEAWDLMKSDDKQKQADGKKILGDLFKDTLKQAFESEKNLSYDEHRLPEFTEITITANELLRVSMFTFTDLYSNKKSESLFEPTGFGGISAKDIAELTAGESLWSMDQKSDKAWEIQSADAKNIANDWLRENKPYEKMINEMNALAEKGKKSIIEADRKEIFQKLAAAEWMLLNNDKMMIDNPEDPLNKVPNWGNRYWKSIIQAREALGIPKHMSMRALIQGDYAESCKAVTNVKYNEKQIDEHVLDSEVRDMYDSLDAQKSEFTIQLEAVSTSLQNDEGLAKNAEDNPEKDRIRLLLPHLSEKNILLNSPRNNNFIMENQVNKDMEKGLT